MLQSVLTQEAADKCTYELVSAAKDICAYVLENCGDQVETINLFKIRFCLIGGEGQGGEPGFYIALVIRKYFDLKLVPTDHLCLLHALQLGGDLPDSSPDQNL